MPGGPDNVPTADTPREADVAAVTDEDAEAIAEAEPARSAAADPATNDAPAEADVAAVTDSDTAAALPEGAPEETEIFYTFTWGGRAERRGAGRSRGRDDRGQQARPKGKPAGGKGKKGPKGDRPQKADSRPPRRDKPIDPSNPFAEALMGLKGKG